MQEQRKQFYTDQKIQGYFLAALIVMELVLASLLMIYLYVEVNNIIDSRLYQMHGVESASWRDIFSLVGKAIGGFVLVNLLVLYAAHILWGRYVSRTLSFFSAGLDKVMDRDFTDSAELKQSHHELIDLMNQWLKKEQQRNKQISELLNRLADYKGKPIEKSDRQALQHTLDEYRQLLSSN